MSAGFDPPARTTVWSYLRRKKMMRLRKGLAVLAVVIGIGAPVAVSAATDASAQTVGCSFYTMKFVSSGVSDCFALAGGTSQTVQLPDTTSISNGVYAGMKFVWYNCANHTQAACASHQQVYTTQFFTANTTANHTAGPIDVVQIIYP